MKKIILLAMVVCLCGCVEGKRAFEYLYQNGYSDVILTGYAENGCQKGDGAYKTGFEAIKDGKETKGALCEGGLSQTEHVRLNNDE